jgi:recombinational DNA repair ATPase RecF
MEVVIMDERSEYVEKLSAQMVEWDNQIEQLKDKAKSATPESTVDHSKTIETLQLKRNEAAEKLQGISTAGDHEWEELKSGTDRVWGEVRDILHDTIMKIK